MAIGIGAKEVKIAIGNIEIAKISLGDTLVYSAGSTVTYYVNSTTMYTEEVDSGASCLSPTTFTPELSGWSFVGWREDTTANGSVLSSKVMGDEPITLYAIFSQTITLSYNGNGATSGSTAVQSGTRYYNASGNFANPSFILRANGFARTDCSFTKWALGSAGGTKYAAGSAVTLSANSVCYALWTVQVKTINIITNVTYQMDIYTNRAEAIRLSNGIDASLYKGATLSLGKVTGDEKWDNHWFDAGIMSSPSTTVNVSSPGTARINIVQYECENGEDFAYKYYENTNVTIYFKETSGTVYLFAGVTESSSGYGTWGFKFDPATITLIPRF